MIGAAFGLGFIIGPVTGGLLSQFDYAVPAFVAAAMLRVRLSPRSQGSSKREDFWFRTF
jgi:MFS transporter, DHA1 family, tetracycline resistance protein